MLIIPTHVPVKWICFVVLWWLLLVNKCPLNQSVPNQVSSPQVPFQVFILLIYNKKFFHIACVSVFYSFFYNEWGYCNYKLLLGHVIVYSKKNLFHWSTHWDVVIIAWNLSTWIIAFVKHSFKTFSNFLVNIAFWVTIAKMHWLVRPYCQQTVVHIHMYINVLHVDFPKKFAYIR